MPEVLIKQDEEIKRPDILTALCLLTFICCSWCVLCSIIQFFKADEQTHAVIKEVRDIMITDEFQRSISAGLVPKIGLTMAEQMVNAFTVQNLLIVAIAALISSLISAYGAILMWNLKKRGFYFYLTGVVIAVATIIILFGANKVVTMGILPFMGVITLFKLLGGSSILAMAIALTVSFVWGFFIILYFRQLKNMD